jgi:hypothetical protein
MHSGDYFCNEKGKRCDSAAAPASVMLMNAALFQKPTGAKLWEGAVSKGMLSQKTCLEHC